MPKAIVCRSRFGSLEHPQVDGAEVDEAEGQEGEAMARKYS